LRPKKTDARIASTAREATEKTVGAYRSRTHLQHWVWLFLLQAHRIILRTLGFGGLFGGARCRVVWRLGNEVSASFVGIVRPPSPERIVRRSLAAGNNVHNSNFTAHRSRCAAHFCAASLLRWPRFCFYAINNKPRH
jgi:hypothetical protein